MGTASDEKSVKLWETETGATVRVLQGQPGNVWHVLWSPDGTMLASSSTDGTVRLWDVGIGNATRVINLGHGEVNSVAWSPCKRLVSAASDKGTVHIYRARSTEPDRVERSVAVAARICIQALYSLCMRFNSHFAAVREHSTTSTPSWLLTVQ